jgi:hypothetical protein
VEGHISEKVYIMSGKNISHSSLLKDWEDISFSGNNIYQISQEPLVLAKTDPEFVWNFWVSGLYPSSGEGTRRFGNWICFRPQVKGGKKTTPLT